MASIEGARVLVVEDEALIAEEIMDRLREMGARSVFGADTAADAIEIAATEAPDIILMDVRLKGNRDGIEAATEIYARHGIPSVFLTAYSDGATIDRVLAAGQFGYLTKPFREKDLATTLNLALHHHQIEQGLRQSHLSLRSVVAQAAQALMAADSDGSLRYANDMASNLIGMTTDEVLGRDADDVIRLENEETGKAESNLVGAVIDQTRAPIFNEAFILLSRDGRRVPIELSVVRIVDGERTAGASISFASLLERRQKERALKEQRTLLGTLIDGMPEAFFAVDSGNRVVVANHALLNIVNLPRSEVIGRNLSEIWSSNGLYDIDRQAAAAMRTGNRITYQQRAWQDPGGHVRWLEFTYIPLQDGERFALIGIAQDVSERREMEEEYLEAASQEQQRLARDLHDGLGQELTSVSLSLKNFESSIARLAPQLLSEVGDIKSAVKRAVEAMREIMRGLVPAVLADGDLNLALRQLALQSTKSFGIRCTYVNNDIRLPPLDPGGATQLYRIANEALMNAARHADASLIEIELAVEDGHVQVSVTDDGIGVSTKRQASGTGMGLRIMDYRASKIAGTLGIEEPGVGTRIIVSAPLSSLIANQTAGVEAGRYGTARGRQPT